MRAPLQLLHPEEVPAQAVQRRVHALLRILEVMAREVVVPGLARGRRGEEDLAHARLEVPRGAPKGAREGAARVGEPRLALHHLPLLLLARLREDRLAARDHLVHGQEDEHAGDAARDRRRGLVAEPGDDLGLDAAEGLALARAVGRAVGGAQEGRKAEAAQTRGRGGGRRGAETRLLQETLHRGEPGGTEARRRARRRAEARAIRGRSSARRTRLYSAARVLTLPRQMTASSGSATRTLLTGNPAGARDKNLGRRDVLKC